MSAKENLISLLKSDQKVKEAIEKLEFGCKIETEKYRAKVYYFDCDKNLTTGYILSNNGAKLYKIEINKNEYFKIIGLQLQERFLRMYCKNKGIRNIHINPWGEILVFNSNNSSDVICTLDNTKDFDNQSEEVYSKIYEALL